jgi:hypothetical protein
MEAVVLARVTLSLRTTISILHRRDNRDHGAGIVHGPEGGRGTRRSRRGDHATADATWLINRLCRVKYWISTCFTLRTDWSEGCPGPRKPPGPTGSCRASRVGCSRATACQTEDLFGAGCNRAHVDHEMKALLVLGCFLLASPAFSQTPKYTNANLGQPVSPARVTPAEAAAILAPHQFKFQPPLPPARRVLGIMSSPTAGPFGEFPEFSPARRLDGTLLSDPAWAVTTWIPYGGWGGGYGGGHRGGARGHGDRRPSSSPGAPAPRAR